MINKRLIFGNGKVSNIVRNNNDIIVQRSECDIRDSDAVMEIVSSHRPDVVINTAANTSLERCQNNKFESYYSNTLGTINLLQAAADCGAKFIHISSGCLFDGNDTISYEDSIPNNFVWYTNTKIWADDYITKYGYDNYLILRPRQMISKVAHPTNMITKFCNYKEIFVHDEPNSITCVEDFKDMLEHLVNIGATGIYNCCNDGSVSPYDIAIGIKKFIKPTLAVHQSSYEFTLSLQENRRVNTILSNEKLKSTGFITRTGPEALNWVLKNYE